MVEMAGFEPAVHPDISRVISITYLRIPPLKTVTRLSLARGSSCGNGTASSGHEYSCSSAYRSVTKATKDIKSRTPEVCGLKAFLRL